MQAYSSAYRGTIFAVSGVVLAIAVCYLTYSHNLSISYGQQQPHLQRRNAVRQRGRRLRSGFSPRAFDFGPIEHALDRLRRRERLGEGYGFYENNFYTQGLSATVPPLALLPSNLENIYTQIDALHNLPEDVLAQVKIHTQKLFLFNFLSSELPEGYIIGDDHVRLSNALQDTFAPDMVEQFTRLFDRGEAAVPVHMHFTSMETDANDEGHSISHSIPASSLARQLGGDEPSSASSQGQNVLDLLYKIGEEQARISGYKHRGVICDSCNTTPIAGIRYRCANCYDFDLCEACEAQGVHDKTHVFYKIRIPLPTRTRAVVKQPKWYPGNPQDLDYTNIPTELRNSLLEHTNLDRQALDAYYDHFKCIAGYSWPDDPSGVCVAIDRIAFDQYFTTSPNKNPPANLIYDRIFSFYDTNSDGLIGFSEFATGMAELANNTTREARIKRLFKTFDLDEDGYVDRRDFLYMLRAHYVLSQEQIHETVRAKDDLILAEEVFQNTIHGNHPISAAFEGSIFPSHLSRHGQGKYLGAAGDLELDDGNGDVLQSSSDHIEQGQEVLKHIIAIKTSNTDAGSQDEPILLTSEDGIRIDDTRDSQLGTLETILRERHTRRDFYFDARASNSITSSMADETSNAFTQKIPMNKPENRYDFSGPSQNFGVDIMYEAIQEGFNDLLDSLFKGKEDREMEAKASKSDREKWKEELYAYERQMEQRTMESEESVRRADLLRTEELIDGVIEVAEPNLAMCGPPAGQLRPTVDVPLPQFISSNNPLVDCFGTAQIERPSQEDLQRWHDHVLTERGILERGGPARLNFEEFKHKLRSDIDWSAIDTPDDQEFWDAKADLGKFSFLSSWLEMASF